MNYDDWKLQTPPEEPDYECPECGAPVNEKGRYCSEDCFNASLL